MNESGIAKIFMHGRSQAVRLPLAFRLPGDRVRVRRVEGGILLEPMVADLDTRYMVQGSGLVSPRYRSWRTASSRPPMPDAEDVVPSLT